MRQFAPTEQGGIFAKFSGKERAVAVLGEPQQLLAEPSPTATTTSTSWDRNAKYHVGITRDDEGRPSGIFSCSRRRTPVGRQTSTRRKTTTMLVMSDSQAQTMGWAMNMRYLVPGAAITDNPRNSRPSLETLHSFRCPRARAQAKASEQIVGTFPGNRRCKVTATTFISC